MYDTALKTVIFRLLLVTGILLCAPSCTLFEFKPPRLDGSALKKLSPHAYPEFSDDMALDGLRSSIAQSLVFLERLPDDRRFWFGDDAFTVGHLKQSLGHFLAFLEKDPSMPDINDFISADYNVYISKGLDDSGDVLFTGYYEPELQGSLKKTDAFKYPVYSLPDDLVFVELSLFGPEFEGRERLVGRHTDHRRVVPYYERSEIYRNKLNGRSRPIAWVKDRVGLFFLEIQGSGKICLTSGGCIKVRYHASNGQPYRSIGALLIEQQKIPREEMSMQRLREYLATHPSEADDILNHNKSFIFFRKEDGGPYGCYDVALTPGRSIALQKRIFPAAGLAFIETSKPVVDGEGRITEWKRFSRFVVNQDTGGAIRGPGRADLFWGNGPYAKIAAGHMQHSGRLYFLVLKDDPSGHELLDSSRQNTY